MENHVFYPILKKNYPMIVKAEGIYQWDDTGKRYTDACCGAVVSGIGHGIKEVNEAIKAQLDEVAFAHRFKFTNRPVQELAALIAELAPGDINWVSFMSGGSEATETAMKMAHEYWIEKGRPTKYKVIARWQSYHGNTLGALSMSGHIGRRRRYAPMLADFPHAAPCYCYRCPFYKQSADCGLECVHNIEEIICQEGAENVAAVIVEPVVGSTLGAVPPKNGYMQELRRICDKYDVLFISDEVMTGMGRTGKVFAVEHWDILPDMICLAKGVSGGYAPLGAVAVREEIHAAFRNGSGRFAHGFTFGGNPLAAAAGVAVIRYVIKHRLAAAAALRGQSLLEKLMALQAKYPAIGDVRGLGMMTGVEFVADRSTKQPFDPSLSLTDKIVAKALENGLMLYGAAQCANGVQGDAIMIAPPLITTEEQLDEIIELFDQTLAQVLPAKK
jgi:adenosylmethionine-8-amino-7-oxononanoate aminotransferase